MLRRDTRSKLTRSSHETTTQKLGGVRSTDAETDRASGPAAAVDRRERCAGEQPLVRGATRLGAPATERPQPLVQPGLRRRGARAPVACVGRGTASKFGGSACITPGPRRPAVVRDE